jgi:hypothetical protein
MLEATASDAMLNQTSVRADDQTKPLRLSPAPVEHAKRMALVKELLNIALVQSSRDYQDYIVNHVSIPAIHERYQPLRLKETVVDSHVQ